MARLVRSLSGIVHQILHRRGRDDLPGDAVAILEPAARAFLATLAQLAPVVVDLGLVGTVDLQRDRLVERELRAAVDRREELAVELEVDREHGPGLARARLAVVGDVRDLRVREDRDVELGCLGALGVEPQIGDDAGHVGPPRFRVFGVLQVRRRPRPRIIAGRTRRRALTTPQQTNRRPRRATSGVWHARCGSDPVGADLAPACANCPQRL